MANVDIRQAADVPGDTLLYTGIDNPSQCKAARESKEEGIDVLYMHPDMQKRVQDGRREEAVRQADEWRMLHQGKPSGSGWFYRRRCWLLCQLGHLLVQVGRQLERFGLSQPAQS